MTLRVLRHALSSLIALLLTYAELGAALQQQPTQDDARALVQAMGERYRMLKSYYAEGSMVLEITSQSDHVNVAMPLVEAEVRPDRVRYEVRDAKFGAARVSDGKMAWRYDQRSNRYTKRPVTGGPVTTSPLSSIGIPEYSNIAAKLTSVRKLGEESLAVNGTAVKCAVVEVVYDTGNTNPDTRIDPRVLWIDPTTGLVIKDVADSMLNATQGAGAAIRMKYTKTLTVVRVDRPVPDDVFEFRPPPGSEELPAGK